MSQQTEENNNINKNPRQNNYAPIILWLFPLLLLNIGWKFSSFIDYRWQEQERVDNANQEVEALSAKSDFSYSFSFIASKFRDSLKSYVELFREESQNSTLVSYIKNNTDTYFKKPFPKYDIFIFKADSSLEKTDILFSNYQDIFDKNLFTNSFNYFVKVNSNPNDFIDGEKTFGKINSAEIFGKNCDFTVIAESQRAKVSSAYFLGNSSWFLWDYFTNKNTGELIGYFIFVENNKNTDRAAKLLAIEEMKKGQKDKVLLNYGAYIPLFPEYGSKVIDEELTKYPKLTLALDNWMPKDIKDLSEWQKNGFPPKMDSTIIDDYEAFSYIGPNQSHAAVIFVPVLQKEKMPNWLIIVDSLVLGLISILLIRGFVWGKWPKISLKTRFIVTYFLAACLPLGLLIISSYGYLSEYRHTAIFKNQTKLKLCIDQLDNGKKKAQDEYKKAFVEVQNDVKIKNLLEKLDKIQGNNNEIMPESKELLTRILNILNKEGRKIPVIAFSIIDERGSCLTNFGNELCAYYKRFDNKEYYLKDVNYNYDFIKKSAFNKDYIYDFSVILSSLREQIEKTGLNNIKWQSEDKPVINDISLFDSIPNTKEYELFAEKINKQTNKIITKTSDNKSFSSIFNYISVDGIPRFAIHMFWDEGLLDEESYISVIRYLGINEPNFIFAAYKVDSQGIISWPKKIDRHRQEFETLSYDLIKQAYYRKSTVINRNNDMSLVAVPSKNFKDVIFVGGVFFHGTEMDIFYRFWICVSVIVLALIIFLVCLHYSSIIFLSPISKLKKLLDKISEGNFDIKIESNSHDEFGLVCDEFNEMTKELSERSKLATLISDHAVEALSKNDISNNESDMELFKGSVLVSDIRNFTGMSEKNEPNIMIELLNNHFAKMTKIISANGGRIYKYIGDAVEVIFVDSDDMEKTSVERAFLTGYEMLKALEEINKERIQKGLFDYKIGIGLSYGSMISGSIGSIETRLDYAIIGDVIDKASKLESASVGNPDFPMVVDSAFKEEFVKVFPNVSFKSLEKDKNGLVISEDGLSAFLEKNNISNEMISNNSIKEKDKNLITDDKSVSVFNIEEDFSFRRKFIPGLIFIIVLAIIMSFGINFVYTTAHKSEKILLTVENNRKMDQILCDDDGKTIFDIKCRNVSMNFQKKIENQKEEDITDDRINNYLNDVFTSDKSLEGININRIFIKVDNFADIENTNDYTFIDKISLKPINNVGFSKEEVEDICKSYKLCIALDSLDRISKKLYLSDKDSETFKNASIKYMKEKYSDPSIKIFGDRVPISVFKDNAKNASIEGIYSGKECFVFWIDFLKGKSQKVLGFLLVSMPSKQVNESIPMLLSSYSNNDTLVSIKNKESAMWSYSQNVSEAIRKEIEKADKQVKVNSENDIKYVGNKYLNSILGVTVRADKDIAGKNYEIYLTRFCKLNEGNPRTALFWVFVIIISMSIVLWRISKGISRINYSVEAKLWVALLIVAVIPVISVFFVFGLFRSEYYSVKNSGKRDEMQRYCDLFEQKSDFSSPLIWNYIRQKNSSEELFKYVKTINDNSQIDSNNNESINNIRNLIKGWINEHKPWDGFKSSIGNFTVDDVFIYGNKGWSFWLNEEKDKSFNFMLKELAFKIVNNDISRDYKVDNSESNIYLDNLCTNLSLDDIKKIYGDKTYLSILHCINSPVFLSSKDNKYGFMASVIPNKGKPESVIIWKVKFDYYDYLKKLAREIKSDYSIFFAKEQNYGDSLQDNNYMRISLGEYANWIASSKLPISTNLSFANTWYIVEGKVTSQMQDSLVLLTLPETAILKDIIHISIGFYLLLGVSLLIIIHTTRGIANDIINPIKSIIEAIREVNKENFAYRINSDRTDELGSLCYSFDKMTKWLDEKRLMNSMLSNTAKKVTLKDNVILSQKTDSVLFYVGIPGFANNTIDSKNSTNFEKLKKQTAILAKIIMEEGGEVDKIMGDKMLAFFSVTNDKSIVAKSACMAAKRLIELENVKKLPLPISIGINFGTVINGFIGVGNKRDFTVIGDAVNVSARIEKLAETLDNDRCLISETFNELISNAFKTEFYGNVELKGKSQPMKVYQLS